MTPPIAISTPAAIAYAVALYALVFAPGAITALKGQGIWLLGGVFFPMVWWYSAVRLALPGSWWDEHQYSPEKQAAARERYGERKAEGWLVAVAVVLLAAPFFVGLAVGF